MTTMQRVVRGVVLVLAIGAVSGAVYWAQTRTLGERAQVSPSMAATPAALPVAPAAAPPAAAAAPSTTVAPMPQPIVQAPATIPSATMQDMPTPAEIERSVYFSTSKAAMAPSFDEPPPAVDAGPSHD